MKPTVGRIVHVYLNQEEVDEKTPHAAIITHVHDNDIVNLDVYQNASCGGEHQVMAVMPEHPKRKQR